MSILFILFYFSIHNSRLQQDGTRESFEYGRYGNPTTKVAEEKIRSVYLSLLVFFFQQLSILCVLLQLSSLILWPDTMSLTWFWFINWSSALEGAESTLLMASGMYASIVTLIALKPEGGGHLVITSDCYRKTRIFILTILTQMGVSVTTFSCIFVFPVCGNVLHGWF